MLQCILNAAMGIFVLAHISPHDLQPSLPDSTTLGAYMMDFVCQKNIQTRRDELVTSVIDVAALTRSSQKRVAVNMLFPKEIASAKPMIGNLVILVTDQLNAPILIV